MLLVKGHNFQINQRLLKITKNNDALYIDYIYKLLDVKHKPFLSSRSGFVNSGAITQQGGDGDPIQIQNPYQAPNMEKMHETTNNVAIQS